MSCLTISPALFERFSQEMKRLGPFEDNPALGVAVSGGSDSLGLAFLLQEWTNQQGGTLHAFHVDHRLRSSSTEEAHQVKTWLEQRGIPCTILSWDHDPKPMTRLQEKARKARYALLEDACAHHDILHLTTAHHAEDQQETHVIRLHAHSTDYGLAGMSAVTYFTHCRLIRPLLSFTKEEIKSTLGSHPHLEDPSNQNPLFLRAQLRQHPLNPRDLSAYQKKRREEEKATAYFLAMHVQIGEEGYGKMPLTAIEGTNGKILQRALSFLIRCIGNTDYFTSPSSIETLSQKWQQKDYSPTSLGRCVLYIHQKKVWVVPDRRLLPPVTPLSLPEKIWDRFVIQGDLPADLSIKPLGPQGWAQIRSHVTPSLPYPVVITFPAYWRDKKVLAVPFLGFSAEGINYPSFLYQPKNSLLAEFFV